MTSLKHLLIVLVKEKKAYNFSHILCTPTASKKCLTIVKGKTNQLITATYYFLIAQTASYRQWEVIMIWLFY